MFQIWQVTYRTLASGEIVCYVQCIWCADKSKACTNAAGRERNECQVKIEIHVDESIEDTQIVVSCRQLTPEMEKLLAMFRILEKKLTVTKKDEICFLDVSKVVYIESVDRKTFIYTEDEVYESDFRLYELEQQLESFGFFRASKSSLIQLQYVKSLRADINRRIKVTLTNGEQLIVSRQYAEGLKKRLGIEQ